MAEHRIALRRAWRLIRTGHDATRIDLPAALDPAWGSIHLERPFHWPDAPGQRLRLRLERVAGLREARLDGEPLACGDHADPTERALTDNGARRRTLTLDVDTRGLDASQCTDWGHVWLVIAPREPLAS